MSCPVAGSRRVIFCGDGSYTNQAILRGKPETEFLHRGDTVRIEMFEVSGHSIFGAIEQTVTG